MVALRGYRSLERLSSGGFADVYAAVAETDGAAVVLKVLRAKGDPRFEREAEMLERVGPPAAPRLIERLRLDDGRPVLCLERVDGEAIDAVAARLGLADRLALLRRAATCVDAIAGRGVVHRDLKPEHLIERAAQVTAIDFGIAVLADGGEPDAGAPGAASITGDGQRIGTARYMSPEMCRQLPASPAADRYAFGVVAFELLAGAPPFSGSAAELRAAHVSRRPPRLSEIAGLPPGLDAPMAAMLDKRPEGRFETAAAFVDALQGALSDDAAAPPPTAATTAGPREERLALVALEGVASTAAIETGGATIAAVGDGRMVLAFAGAPSLADGVRRACLAGRSALATGARAALVVVAGARVRERRGGVRVSGASVRELAARGELDRGLRLDAAAAAVLDPGATRALGGDRFELSALDASVLEPSLRGRGALLDALDAALEPTPALIAVTGGPGLGKSRLASAIADRLAERRETWLLAPSPDQAPGTLIAELVRRTGQQTAPELRAVAGLATPTAEPWEAAGSLRRRAAEALAAAIERTAADRGGLALVIDDGHRVHSAALDAIELATMGEAPVVVVVVAGEALETLRPSFGSRAARFERRALEPLAAADASGLVVELLGSAETLAGDVIERIVELAGGVPLYLVELARALRAGGTVRQRGDREGGFLAGDELASASAPLAARIGRARLDALPAGLARFARICAVVAEPLEVDWLAGLWSDPAIDPSYGLDQLRAAGLLIDGERGLEFRHALVREGIVAAAPPAEVRAISAAALAACDPDAGDRDSLARRFRHASRAGEAAIAARAAGALAERFRRGHSYGEAEIYFGLALDQLEPGSPDTEALHVGRADVRMKIFRFADARDDNQAALELARARGDDAAVLERLLWDATICDWSFDFERSAARVDEAVALCAGGELADRFAGPLALGRGRAAYRREQLDAAIAELETAARLAKEAGDRESWVAAMMLSAPSLLYADRLEDAERCYDEIVADCEASGDLFHLGAAHNNRQLLWLRQGDLERAAADLGRAIELARRLGNVHIEWSASHNLAEILHWAGRLERAGGLARRAHELQIRFVTDTEIPDDALLRARIAAAAGRETEARELLDHAGRACADTSWSPSASDLRTMLELVLSDGEPAAWRELIGAGGDSAHVDLELERLWFAARAAARRGDRAHLERWRQRAIALAHRSRTWRERFDNL